MKLARLDTEQKLIASVQAEVKALMAKPFNRLTQEEVQAALERLNQINDEIARSKIQTEFYKKLKQLNAAKVEESEAGLSLATAIVDGRTQLLKPEAELFESAHKHNQTKASLALEQIKKSGQASVSLWK